MEQAGEKRGRCLCDGPPRSLEPGGNQAGRKHEQDEWNQIGQIQRQGEAGDSPGREGQAETPTAAR